METAEFRTSRWAYRVWATVYVGLTAVFLCHVWWIVPIFTNVVIVVSNLDVADSRYARSYKAGLVISAVLAGSGLLVAYGWLVVLSARRARMLWGRSMGIDEEQDIEALASQPVSNTASASGRSSIEKLDPLFAKEVYYTDEG